MRIAIVNDATIAVEALKRVLIAVPECELAWIADNGADAVAKCAKDTPDLILMNLIMPIMDGVEATRQIMKDTPCAILVVTASVAQNSGKVFEALGCGAIDAVSTPVFDGTGNSTAQALLVKIAMIRKLIGKSTTNHRVKVPYSTDASSSPLSTTLPPLIVIGSSTGGPSALATILSHLPANFGAAIAIVQHVNAQFTPGLVEWLNQQTPLPIKIAKVGDRLEAGKVLIAGTDDHLKLLDNLTLTYTKQPVDYPYRPSVNVLFKSVADHWHCRGTAVVLTGMGRDGAEGLSALRQRGWHTIVQDEQSCVVYGMPKAAVELGAAVESLAIDAISTALIRQIRKL
jgi:two-component system, chemotaxis family, response regulator WspF